jgi:hypothetical protein
VKGIIRVLSVLICLSLAAAMPAAAESGKPRQGKGQGQNPGNGQDKGGRGGFAPSESEVAAQEEGLQRAYELYLEANELYSDDIGADLNSPQAASNVAAFEKWWEAAYDYGFIPAATKIFGLFDGSSGGFVKDAVSPNYLEMEDSYAIIPYPKFDENQENYISLDWGGLMCIPTTIGNPDLVGATLELLAYESANEVIPTYYDVLLEGKLARDTDTIAMLDILFDTIAYEVGGNYFGFESGLSDLFYTTARLCFNNKSTDFASWYKGKEKTSSKLIERFYKSLDELEALD